MMSSQYYYIIIHFIQINNIYIYINIFTGHLRILRVESGRISAPGTPDPDPSGRTRPAVTRGSIRLVRSPNRTFDKDMDIAHDLTGWNFVLLMGGPDPKLGGNIHVYV